MRKRQKKEGRKINQRDKLNHDKVICGREEDETEMSRKSFQLESRLQGQSFKHVRVYLSTPIFSYG